MLGGQSGDDGMVGRGGAAGNTWLVPRLGGAGSLVAGLSGAGLGGGPGLLGVGLGGALGGAAVGATGGSVGRSVGLGWHMVDGPGQVGGFGSNGLNCMVRVGGPGMTLGALGLDLNLLERTLKKRISVFPTGANGNIGNTGPNRSFESGVQPRWDAT